MRFELGYMLCLCGEMIMEKYGVLKGGWRKKDVNVPYGCRMWRNILKGWEEFSSKVSFWVGDGMRLVFGAIVGAG